MDAGLLVMCLRGLGLRVDGGYGRRAAEGDWKLFLREGTGRHLELQAEDGRLQAVLVLDGRVRPEVVRGGLQREKYQNTRFLELN